MITGLPCKTLDWKIDSPELQEKIIKTFNKYESKVRFAYINPLVNKRGIPENHPFIIMDYVKLDEDMPCKPDEFFFLLL